MSELSSFLKLKNTPFYVYYIYHILFTQLPVDGNLFSFHLLAIVNNAAMNKYLLPILLVIDQEMELLNHIVILFLIVCGTTTVFCIAAASFYTAIDSTQRFQFLHILTSTCYFLFSFFFFK